MSDSFAPAPEPIAPNSGRPSQLGASSHDASSLLGAFERRFGKLNPVWLRELKQAARLQRTPIILAMLTGMMTLLVCSVGGVASTSAEPAKVGVGIFHTFFSLAFAVVTWVGPAVAANTIAGERSGRTWEALQLTALNAESVARGKFLAAFTYISLYVVMLAPVGALPFLFGGVTASDVLIAFVLLFLMAGLSVAFGLSVSAKFASPAVAIIITLVVALPVSLAVYGGAGVGLSFAAHSLWPGIPGGPPVWLPTAYMRADFGLPYAVFLIFLPLVCASLPAWLFYEVTIANMGAPSDDRSSRLRIWFLCSMPLMSLAAALVTFATHSEDWAYAGSTLIWFCGCFGAYLFAGEPLGPSPRVLTHWQREGRSAFRRFLGPGILRASVLLFCLTSLGLAANLLTGIAIASSAEERAALIAFHGYTVGFFAFVAGFNAWLRARGNQSGGARLVLSVTLFLVIVGPWIAMAMAGMLTSEHDRAILMASPSPTFAIAMAQAIRSSSPDHGLTQLTGCACAVAWAFIGMGSFAAASLRVNKRLQAEAQARNTLQAAFDEEERAAAASGSAVVSG